MRNHEAGAVWRRMCPSFRNEDLEHRSQCLWRTRVSVVHLRNPKAQTNNLPSHPTSFVLSSYSAASSSNLCLHLDFFFLQLDFKGIRFYPFKQCSNFKKILQIKRFQGFRCAEDTFKQDVICIDHSKVLRGRV